MSKTMEEEKKQIDRFDGNIPFSRAVKAGKRIYYVDVKESRNGEYYLALTESKKLVSGSEDNPQVTFEKHKLFLYREDFDKVLDALNEAISFVEEQQGKAEPRPASDKDIHIDVEF
ncbi:MAG: PUR family DNA/RNA-binding protein [Bacteroidaceae bacterium]|nr:PUR family DNA/RNA-binding protein [Bacteroidaceae bacterium]